MGVALFLMLFSGRSNMGSVIQQHPFYGSPVFLLSLGLDKGFNLRQSNTCHVLLWQKCTISMSRDQYPIACHTIGDLTVNISPLCCSCLLG